jgi:hypothetical protein
MSIIYQNRGKFGWSKKICLKGNYFSKGGEIENQEYECVIKYKQKYGLKRRMVFG